MTGLERRLLKTAARVETRVPLKQYTSFRIGGVADYIAYVDTVEQLCALLHVLGDVPFYVLGGGCNTLFPDDGYRGVIVRLEGALCDVTVDGDGIAAGGAASLTRIAAAALHHGLSGAEFLCGIPGTLGGGVVMNAGAYGGELSQLATRTTYVGSDGAVHELHGDAHEFGYRHSYFGDHFGIIVQSALRLCAGDPTDIRARMDDLTARRKSKQPLEYPSAGSAFKRPVGGYAAQLIDEAGLKGTRIGGAEVSQKHAGFIVNIGGATCYDVLRLMELVRRRVYDTSGVELEPEVKIIKNDRGYSRE